MNGQRSGRACAARCATAAPSTRCTRTPWPGSPPRRRRSTRLDGPARRPDGPGVRRHGDAVGGGQGAARLRPDQPAARRSRAASSAPSRAHAPTTSRPSPTCRRARCCSPSSPVPCRRRSVKTAGLLQALPRNFAYGLQALIDKRRLPPEPAADEPTAPEPAAEPPTRPTTKPAQSLSPRDRRTTDTGYAKEQTA